MKVQAYIAGCYSAPTEAQVLHNVAEALRAGLVLARLGWAPIVPHASGDHRVTWHEAMSRCRGMVEALVPGRDLLVYLPGSQESTGTQLEIGWAKARGVRVVAFEEVIR